MRFLKNKIAMARGLPLQSDSPTQNPIEIPQIPVEIPPVNPITPRFQRAQNTVPVPEPPVMVKKHISGDNIIKNYGRAMTNFAMSNLSKQYLISITNRLGITIKDFQDYIEKKKKSANCIKQLRNMLPLGEDPRDPDLDFKKAFQQICIVFLKFFCVNWLYSSKIAEKIAHLKYRFKIMRRIKNPQHFTYLKDFNDRM